MRSHSPSADDGAIDTTPRSPTSPSRAGATLVSRRSTWAGEVSSPQRPVHRPLRVVGRGGGATPDADASTMPLLSPAGLRSGGPCREGQGVSEPGTAPGPVGPAPPPAPTAPDGGEAAGAPAFTHAIPRRTRLAMLAAFTLVAALLSADQNLLAPSLSAVAAEFGMGDADKDRRAGVGGWKQGGGGRGGERRGAQAAWLRTDRPPASHTPHPTHCPACWVAQSPPSFLSSARLPPWRPATWRTASTGSACWPPWSWRARGPRWPRTLCGPSPSCWRCAR